MYSRRNNKWMVPSASFAVAAFSSSERRRMEKKKFGICGIFWRESNWSPVAVIIMSIDSHESPKPQQVDNRAHLAGPHRAVFFSIYFDVQWIYSWLEHNYVDAALRTEGTMRFKINSFLLRWPAEWIRQKWKFSLKVESEVIIEMVVGWLRRPRPTVMCVRQCWTFRSSQSLAAHSPFPCCPCTQRWAIPILWNNNSANWSPLCTTKRKRANEWRAKRNRAKNIC